MFDQDRRAELIAAAVANDLTPEETAELNALRAADPSITRELADLRALAADLPKTWDESQPSPSLREKVVELVETSEPVASVAEPVEALSPPTPPVEPVETPTPTATPATSPVADLTQRRRRPWLLPVTAAACLALGATAALSIDTLSNLPPTGGPGTLGAIEPITFDGEPSGTTVDGSLVAHTWGTETFLEIDGLPVGDTYSVVLVDESGESFDSGSFIGATATVDCRMNAAVMREEVTTVQIQDAQGAVVATAALPSAS
jgi:hypothetical protein